MSRHDDTDDDPEFEDSLGDDDFDYDEFVEQEFGSKPTTNLHPLWKVVAVGLLLLFLAGLIAL